MDKIPYSTLLIDDEAPARQRLQRLLQDFTAVFDVVGEATNGFEGIEMIGRYRPEVIFLDIQMPGMSGFEMLGQLQEIPMVIFCTAHDNYSLKAFETNSLDYLVKPVKRERLARTVDKLAFFKKEDQAERLIQLFQQMEQASQKVAPTSLTVKSGKKITFVKLVDIAYFKANDKYVSLFSTNGKEHVTDLTLNQLEGQLPNSFLRIHRSLIINTDTVKEVQPYFNGRYAFAMDDRYATKLISGRTYAPKLKAWMGI